MMAKLRFLVIATLIAAGCNALTGIGDLAVAPADDAGVVDATVIDVAPSDTYVPPTETPDADASVDASDSTTTTDADAATVAATPVTCNVIHQTEPTAASGTYTIDSDGPGPDPSYSVYCDMDSLGGGWTEVFRWTHNLGLNEADWTAGTTALFKSVTNVLITYRTASGPVVGGVAMFPMPAAWMNASPFKSPPTDITVDVSVNGAAAASHLLRYGNGDFLVNCQDAWFDSGTYGRMCIVGTTAPYFDGWNDPEPDHCNSSDQGYNTTLCATTLELSIAVR